MSRRELRRVVCRLQDYVTLYNQHCQIVYELVQLKLEHLGSEYLHSYCLAAEVFNLETDNRQER